MARTSTKTKAEAQNTNTATDWAKTQRKAVRSFLKRAQAHGVKFIIQANGQETTINAMELNSLIRTLGIMTAQQKEFLEGAISLEELVDKLDTSFGYWLSDDDDYSNAE